MGCFASVCGISRTAIMEDDKCVVIVFNLPYKFVSFYRLNQLVYQQKENENKENYFFKEGTGFYHKPIKDVLIGTYDDYGWIKEKEERQEEGTTGISEMRHLFFHVWAIEHIFKKKINELKFDLDFVLTLFDNLSYLRTSPIDNLLGNQYDDIGEIKFQISLNNRINKYLEEKLKIYQKEYGE